VHRQLNTCVRIAASGDMVIMFHPTTVCGKLGIN